MSDKLYYDKSSDGYFRAPEESVEIAESLVQDIVLGIQPVSIDQMLELLDIDRTVEEDDIDTEKKEESVVIIGERKFETITMAEFLEATRTKPDCWLFKDNGENVQFTKSTPMPDSDEMDIYYEFFDGINTIHRFKEMDGEIWHAVCYWSEHHKGYSMWQPWTGREW